MVNACDLFFHKLPDENAFLTEYFYTIDSTRQVTYIYFCFESFNFLCQDYLSMDICNRQSALIRNIVGFYYYFLFAEFG